MMDALANGRRIKYLTVVDDYSGECVGIAAESGIGGQYVTHVLDQVGQLKTVCGLSGAAVEWRLRPQAVIRGVAIQMTAVVLSGHRTSVPGVAARERVLPCGATG